MRRPPVPVTTNNKTTATDRKPGVFTMAANRPPAKAPQTTPVGRRVINSQQLTPSPNTLHPNVTTRSPRSSAGRRTDLRTSSPEHAARTPTRPQSAYIAKPPSSTGSAKSDAAIPSHSGNAQPGELAKNNRTSRFFHASEVNSSKSQQTTSSSSSKFFHADSLQQSHQPQKSTGPPRLARNLQPAPHLGPHVPGLAPGHVGQHRAVSPPPNRPSSRIGQRTSLSGTSKPPTLTPSTVPDTRNHVKFVYANGAEEVLAPRNSGSEVGSTTSSPQLPSSPIYSNNPSLASPLHSYFPLSPTASPAPMASPTLFYRSPNSPVNSRRSSCEVKMRHDRTLSIGSTLDISQTLNDEQKPPPDKVGGPEDEVKSSESAPSLMTAKERIQAMEEAAANARRERKVMDLEISNTSLMAINKTLEREMRKQAAELRRYRRLSRSGRLSITPSATADRRDTLGSDLNDSGLDNLTDYSDGEQSEEETPSDDFDEDLDGSEDSNSVNDEKHRASDERRLKVDISKHQALLDASAKMNTSLRRCSALTDQLINEGKKALEYKVRPSDIQLGGRILHEDEDEYGGGVNIEGTVELEGYEQGMNTQEQDPVLEDLEEDARLEA